MSEADEEEESLLNRSEGNAEETEETTHEMDTQMSQNSFVEAVQEGGGSSMEQDLDMKGEVIQSQEGENDLPVATTAAAVIHRSAVDKRGLTLPLVESQLLYLFPLFMILVNECYTSESDEEGDQAGP